MISVVVPLFNAAEHLAEQLEALRTQSYRGPWELIIADNGSTDGSQQLARSWMDRIPWMRVVDASSRRGAAAARNIGASAARGEAFAFCDSDDVASSEWLAGLAEALRRWDFVTGAIDHTSLNRGPTAAWQTSHVTSAPRGLRFMPYALSGNMAVTREAFDKVGGFTEDLGTVGEDVDLSWKLQLAGYRLHFEPSAVIAYRHRHDLRGLWRTNVDFGMADPELFRRFRSYGFPPLRPASMAAAYFRLIVHLPRLFSARSRGQWVREAAKRWGRLRGSLRSRALYL